MATCDAIYSESRHDVAERDAIYSESRHDVAECGRGVQAATGGADHQGGRGGQGQQRQGHHVRPGLARDSIALGHVVPGLAVDSIISGAGHRAELLVGAQRREGEKGLIRAMRNPADAPWPCRLLNAPYKYP